MEETSPTIRTDVGMRYNAAEISRSLLLLQKKKAITCRFSSAKSLTCVSCSPVDHKTQPRLCDKA